MAAPAANAAVPGAALGAAEPRQADTVARPAVRGSVLLIASDLAAGAAFIEALRQLELDELALHGPLTEAAELKARLAATTAAALALVVRTPPQAPPELQQAEAQLRALLCEAGVSYAVVDATDGGRLRAVAAVRATLRPPVAPRWRWMCADCDDGECESHPAASLPAGGAADGAAAPAAAAADAGAGIGPAGAGGPGHGA